MMETKNDFIEYLQEMQDTELTTNQKVIQYLKNNGVSNNDISKLLNITERNVYYLISKMKDKHTEKNFSEKNFSEHIFSEKNFSEHIFSEKNFSEQIATGDIATKLQEKVDYRKLYTEACEKFRYNMGKELTDYFEQWDELNYSAKDGIAGLCELTVTEIETIYQWWQENR